MRALALLLAALSLATPAAAETLSNPIANTHAEPLRLVIDTVVPEADSRGR